MDSEWSSSNNVILLDFLNNNGALSFVIENDHVLWILVVAFVDQDLGKSFGRHKWMTRAVGSSRVGQVSNESILTFELFGTTINGAIVYFAEVFLSFMAPEVTFVRV